MSLPLLLEIILYLSSWNQMITAQIFIIGQNYYIRLFL